MTAPALPDPAPPKTRKQRADERRARAGELFMQGLSFREIAIQGGFGNPGNAHRLVTEFLERSATDPGTIAHQRRVENLRLDTIWRIAWPKAAAGDTTSQRILLEVSRARRELNGLNRPLMLTLDVPGNAGVDAARTPRTLGEILPADQFADVRSLREQALAIHRALPPGEQVS